MTLGASKVKGDSLVERIADAVLYEGYILYPYRSSAVKNQQRWNFGVVCPLAWETAQQGTESSRMRTECLLEVEPGSSAAVEVRLRFLHLLLREIAEPAAENQMPRSWQEAVAREVIVPAINVSELDGPRSVKFEFPASKSVEGSVVRAQRAIAGEIEIAADRRTVVGGRQLLKLSVVVRNLTGFENSGPASRDEALMHSFVSTHTILDVHGGAFVSLLDPPDDLKTVASECVNTGTYPVLVGEEGERCCILSSPIILYDYPQIASQSTGDLFDGTEIDEILTLRIMSLTDEEKREMRSTDELARRLLERTESMSPEQLMNLHGVMKKV